MKKVTRYCIGAIHTRGKGGIRMLVLAISIVDSVDNRPIQKEYRCTLKGRGWKMDFRCARKCLAFYKHRVSYTLYYNRVVINP
jgi:hypothetical protein